MSLKHSQIVSYVKASWLAGNRREDCAAEIVRMIVNEYGIVNESRVYNLIDATYFALNRPYIELCKQKQIEGE